MNRIGKLSPGSLWLNGKFKCLINSVNVNGRILTLSMERGDYYDIAQKEHAPTYPINSPFQLGISTENTAIKAFNAYLSETSVIEDPNVNLTKVEMTMVADQIKFVRSKDIPPKCKQCYGTDYVSHERIVELLDEEGQQALSVLVKETLDSVAKYFSRDINMVSAIVEGHFPHMKDQLEKLKILI